MGRKQPWDHHVDGRARGAAETCVELTFRDAKIAADTAARLRNLGLVVLEHSRPAPREATRFFRR